MVIDFDIYDSWIDGIVTKLNGYEDFNSLNYFLVSRNVKIDFLDFRIL